MLQAGIVGLPNVGKSTLFNAVTRSRKAEAANYPFCTIDPNIGVVQVPDERLEVLRAISNTKVIIPAAIEIMDIAGLVKGASTGEGLGNKFLANIRECDAIIQVVRCFENDDIIHTMGSVDPVRDIEVIAMELILADMESVDGQLDKVRKKARSGDKDSVEVQALLEKVKPHLEAGKPAITLDMTVEERARLKGLSLLSAKPIIFACNVSESDLAAPGDNAHVAKVRAFVAGSHNAKAVILSGKMEEELSELPPEEAKEYLTAAGVTDSGVSQLIRATYDLLGLASYFTAGEKEVHAWTFKKGMKAPQCAGVIHTDFEAGFIKAEVVAYEDLKNAGSVAAARDVGKYRMEGRDYEFKDGDVALFRFNR